MENLICLESFSTYSEAKLAANRLEQAGVKSVLQAGAIGGVMMAEGSDAGPHELYIQEHELERAKEVLGL
jgi:hypothetical protein